MWGIRTPAQAKEIIERQIKEAGIGEPANLEEQAIRLVGTDVYEKLVKGYTQKQWGRECRELPAFIIKRLPLRFTYDNNYFNDPYQGIPMEGYTKMVEKMLEGVEVRLETDYFQVKDTIDAVCTVFTGMIDEFFGYRLGHLEYRSLRFETELLDCDNFQGNAVVNYTSAEVPYTRVIEHKHFNFGTQPVTVVTREYSLEWKPGEEAYYPVNNAANTELYQKYRDMASCQKNLVMGGRLGQYQYFDMDKVIASSLECVERVSGNVHDEKD
jgi:UDP-galactopyranose mutase